VGLNLIFHYADQQGLPLIDLKDLRSVVTFLTTTEEGQAQLKTLGAVSNQTAGKILGALINLEAAGGDALFGEPDLDPADLLRVDGQGRGVISLFGGGTGTQPEMLPTFLVWVLADLAYYLPDAGDIEKPRAVLVLDEAHLLFRDASSIFLDMLEQVLRSLRSKGVGVFLCTERPTSIPDAVSSSVGTRIQHAIRAVTSDSQLLIAELVRTYPKSEIYDLASALMNLGTGEAIVTSLTERGAPTPVAYTKIRSPRSQMDGIGPDVMQAAAHASPLFFKYGATIDGMSAYAMIAGKMVPRPKDRSDDLEPPDLPSLPTPVASAEPSVLEQMKENPAFKNAMKSAGTVIGQEITRSIFGTRRRR
jgi:DNA helicase HerA-like ATPase